MDISMGGFAMYELINVQTGMALYQTCATASEIIQANANLRDRSYAMRFYPAGTFSMPNLHDPTPALCAAV